MDNKNKLTTQAILGAAALTTLVGCSPKNPVVETSNVETKTETTYEKTNKNNVNKNDIQLEHYDKNKSDKTKKSDPKINTKSLFKAGMISYYTVSKDWKFDESEKNSNSYSESQLYDFNSIDLSDYNGVSIDEALVAKGIPYNEVKAFRIAAATYYGMDDYCVDGSISAEKNIELMRIFKLPVNERPGKQQQVEVNSNEFVVEEGMRGYERVEVWFPLNSKTHVKTVKLCKIGTFEEKILSSELENCEFEYVFNPLINEVQRKCKHCQQFVYGTKQNNSNSSVINNTSQPDNHSDQTDQKTTSEKVKCDHHLILTIRYRPGIGGHFVVKTFACSKCNYIQKKLDYVECVGEWKYDPSSNQDYCICEKCGSKNNRPHEHNVIDAHDDFIWTEGTETHSKVSVGSCSMCGKEVVQIKKKNIPCSKKPETIDGNVVQVCTDCHHRYPELVDKCEHNVLESVHEKVEWNKGTDTHQITEEGTCKECKETVTKIKKPSEACKLTFHYKNIGGAKKDVPVCDDCKHEYLDKAEEHTRHNLIGEPHFTYEHDDATDKHRITNATKICDYCKQEIPVELTDEQKEWHACSYGEELTDSDGNKYQECSVCGYKKNLEIECKHDDLENVSESIEWNQDTDTHKIIEEGICTECGEPVIKIKKPSEACDKKWKFKDGYDICECLSCGHEYEKNKHSHDVDPASIKTDTDPNNDEWCVKTTGTCKTCSETYILLDQSQGHDPKFDGYTTVYNQETGEFETKEKHVCGNCGRIEYKNVENKKESEVPEETETEEISEKIESEIPEETETEAVSEERESEVPEEPETEPVSEERESEIPEETETEAVSEEIESEVPEKTETEAVSEEIESEVPEKTETEAVSEERESEVSDKFAVNRTYYQNLLNQLSGFRFEEGPSRRKTII